MVEKEHLASAVYYGQNSRPSTVINWSLSGVDASRLEEVDKRFVEILKETSEKELDMAYLKDCLAREKRQQKFAAESREQFFTESVITTFLFDKTRSLKDLTHLREFDELEQWTDSDWRAFLKKWLADAHRVTVLGVPSEALSKKLKADEEARVEEQIKRLGESGLKELGQKLEEANAENNRPIPDEIFDKFKVPSTDTIHFISTIPARAGADKNTGGVFDNEIQKIIDQDKTNSSMFIHFEHVPSNFVHINLLIGTSQIPVPLRPLLVIFMDNFFNTPIMRNGKRQDFEDVVKELERDTVSYSMGSAKFLGNAEMLSIELQIEVERYSTAIQWLKDLLWGGIFDVEVRDISVLSIRATKLTSSSA